VAVEVLAVAVEVLAVAVEVLAVAGVVATTVEVLAALVCGAGVATGDVLAKAAAAVGSVVALVLPGLQPTSANVIAHNMTARCDLTDL